MDTFNGPASKGCTSSSVYHFEIGPIRPPSEGNDRSLLLRVNRNCPWNNCRFCNTYRGERFDYRGVEEVMRDVDVVRNIRDLLVRASWQAGRGGRIDQQVIEMTIGEHQDIYARGATDNEVLSARLHSLANVAGWLSTGARTVFLQDANAIIMRAKELIRVLGHLRETFPTIERITSYGRARTADRRTIGELQSLREAGLSRLHVGLESGCDEVLAFMKKGVTAEQQIRAGKKIKAGGITLSEYVMPGLGGKRWTERHARDTAEALNQIDPDFIRLRSLIVRRNSALAELEAAGDFEPLDEDGVVDEIGLMIEALECQSYLASDQMSNLLWEVEGKLPEEKPKILETIRSYQRMSHRERLRFRLQRRAQSYVSVYGGASDQLMAKLMAASAALDNSRDPGPVVEAAIALLKQGFV